MVDYTEVDGVPTLIAPTTGPMRAGLAFRVGRSDEILSRSGTTHLIEHLALHHLGLTDYHFNGTTGSVVTEFHLQGAEQDIVSFLGGVCASLHNLPMDRLELERSVVRTEWSSRSRSAVDAFPVWRHGARDHGLLSYPEYGLPMLRPEDLERWAAYYFTRENAVLWIAGAGVPAGLRLPLPGGQRRPVPAPSSALPEAPAYFGGPDQVVAVNSVVRHRTAAGAYANLLKRELFRSLRQRDGLSYSADSGYESRGDGFAEVTALIDALPEKQDAALGGFVDVLAGLRVGRIDQAELDAFVKQTTELLDHPEAPAGRLPGQAAALLTGQPLRSIDEFRSELAAVTAADVHAVAVEAASTALLMVPEGHTADWAGFVAAPTVSEAAVAGQRYRSLSSDVVNLVVGPDGVSLTDARDAITVRYDQCAALLVWPDGARMLIGADGIQLRIEPTFYAVEPGALRAIDTAVPAQAHVLQQPRDPDQIPKPPAKRPSPRKPIAERQLGRAAYIVPAIAVLLGLLVAVNTISVLGQESISGEDWAVLLGGWVLTLYLGSASLKIIGRNRMARRR